jgi:hypothetical protein
MDKNGLGEVILCKAFRPYKKGDLWAEFSRELGGRYRYVGEEHNKQRKQQVQMY